MVQDAVGKGAKVALLTTEGHRDVLEMREGLKGAPRTREVEEIRGEFVAIDRALAALAPGDLCLVLVDQVDEALAHLHQRIAEAGVSV